MVTNINWCAQEQREKVPAEQDLCSAPARREPTGEGDTARTDPVWSHCCALASLSPRETTGSCSRLPGRITILLLALWSLQTPRRQAGDGCWDREYLLASLLHGGKEELHSAYVVWQNILLSAGDDRLKREMCALGMIRVSLVADRRQNQEKAKRKLSKNWLPACREHAAWGDVSIGNVKGGETY